MNDFEADAVETFLALGRAREHDLGSGGRLLAAVNDWHYAGEDLRLPDTLQRFCAAYNCSPDAVARLLDAGPRP